MKQLQLPALFSQQDSRWSAFKLGFNTDPQFNLRMYGCLDTCLAMVSRYYGKQVDPALMNEMIKNVHGFVDFGGDYKWGSLHLVFGDIGETYVRTPEPLSDMQINTIKSSIDNGYPVVVAIDAKPATVTPGLHYVVIIGYDNTDENNFTIADPWDGSVKSLKSYLGWFKPSARTTIESYCIYTGIPAVQASDSIVVKIADNERNVMKATQYDSLCTYFKLDSSTMASTQQIIKIVEALYKQVKDQQDTITAMQTDFNKQSSQAQEDIKMLATQLKQAEDALKKQSVITTTQQEQITQAVAKADAVYAHVPVSPPVTTTAVSYHEAAGEQVDTPHPTLLDKLLSFFIVTVKDYGKLKNN